MKTSDKVKNDPLKNVPAELRWAAKQDVSGLRDFFMNNPGMPYVTCGMGGAFSSCVYSALLYGAHCGLGRAMTCFALNSLSDATLLGSKVLINSAGGRNDDVVQVADRLHKLNHPAAANLTMFDNRENRLKKKISALNPAGSFNLNGHEVFNEGETFVNITPAITSYSLYYKAFTGKTDFTELDLRSRYTYTANDGQREVPPLQNIDHFVVLYGGYGEPVAYDFESIIVESGFASVQLADYRNFTHGRFCFVGNHLTDGNTAVVMLVTPREKGIVERYRKISNSERFKGSDQVLPDNTPVITLETEHDSPLASIDLLIQQTRLYSDISDARGVKSLGNPVCKNIDKRAPRSLIRFIKDLQKAGPITLK